MNESRRAVLAACGAGVVALAGCSGLGFGEDDPTYDTAGLADLVRDVPRPPATFPVSVPDAMVSRHRERARTLLERVPAQPAVPNEAVAGRLREERASVIDRLETDEEATSDPLEPLAEARAVRAEAAAVDAAYRAATNAITREAVADRRSQLRSDRLTFERDWTYRGDDAAAAVVVHRRLEELLSAVRSGIAPGRAFPEDPTTGVFRVGELVSGVEAGRAALADAGRLRTRYIEGLSDPRPYRTAISVAAGHLRRIRREYSHELDGFTDPDFDDLPFDRSIEGTPLERLYVRAVDGVEIFRTDAEEARHRGDHATELVASGVSLTVLRALESVVADIRNDRITVPETIDGIAAARREAIDGLERAWSTAPTILAAELARWAWLLVFDAADRLHGPAYGRTDETPDTGDAYDVWAIYVTATRVAAAVPRTVADVREGLPPAA